jgi:hypothetical protein
MYEGNLFRLFFAFDFREVVKVFFWRKKRFPPIAFLLTVTDDAQEEKERRIKNIRKSLGSIKQDMPETSADKRASREKWF